MVDWQFSDGATEKLDLKRDDSVHIAEQLDITNNFASESLEGAPRVLDIDTTRSDQEGISRLRTKHPEASISAPFRPPARDAVDVEALLFSEKPGDICGIILSVTVNCDDATTLAG